MTTALQIAGLGRYLPQQVIPNTQILAELGIDADLEALSGVSTRHRASIENGETTVKMAANAAMAACEDAQIHATDIDLILHCSAIPEQALPDTASLIQAEMNLSHTGVQCQSIHMSCLGFVAALELASLYIETQKKRCILIVCAELASVGLNPNDPKTYSLFGDGAAAAIVIPTPAEQSSQLITSHFETHSEHATAAQIKGGGTRRHPNTAHCLPEDNYFSMNGPLLLRGSLRHARSALRPFSNHLTNGLDGIDLFVPHQPSKVGLQAMEKALPAERMHTTLAQFGNCISASIPLTLFDAREQQRFERGDTLLLIGTGAGLTIGGALLKW